MPDRHTLMQEIFAIAFVFVTLVKSIAREQKNVSWVNFYL